MTLSQQSQGMLKYAEQICYSSKETLRFTYDCAVKMRDKEGVYVECGVAAGAQIIAMAAGAPDKIIYAFDSFEGIPWPSNRDDQMPGIRKLDEDERKRLPDPGKQILKSSGATSVPEEDFINHLQSAGVNLKNIISCPGWFEHTVKLFGQLYVNISILRLDGDLYNSTFVCLQHLFSKVQKGGIVIVDDWQLPGCRASCEEYFELIKYSPDWKFISNIAYFEK
jgi:hypothetical protein